MKKVFFIVAGFFLFASAVSSCKKNSDCLVCSGATVCESDYDKTGAQSSVTWADYKTQTINAGICKAK